MKLAFTNDSNVLHFLGWFRRLKVPRAESSTFGIFEWFLINFDNLHDVLCLTEFSTLFRHFRQFSDYLGLFDRF